MTTTQTYATTLTLPQAEKRLTQEYKSRQKRYAKSVHGARRGGGNAFNETHFADLICALENRVDDLGGDSCKILRAVQEIEAAR